MEDTRKYYEYTIEDYEKELRGLERVKERLLCNQKILVMKNY